MLASTLLSPGLGAWADVSDRKRVVTYGVLVQAVAVLGSTAVLALALRDTKMQGLRKGRTSRLQM